MTTSVDDPNEHRHVDAIRLPDGTTIWCASFAEDGYERSLQPDFGLYFDRCWQPPWHHRRIAWPDFGLPPDHDALVADLGDVLRQARQGSRVEIGCIAGHGRTGTALGCLAVLADISSDPVTWVRGVYCSAAIETEEQSDLIRDLWRGRPTG